MYIPAGYCIEVLTRAWPKSGAISTVKFPAMLFHTHTRLSATVKLALEEDGRGSTMLFIQNTHGNLQMRTGRCAGEAASG